MKAYQYFSLWIAVSLIVVCNSAFAGEQCASSELALQVLGSGGPEFYKNRASSSYIVWYKGKAIALVDAGSGSKLRFAQSGANFNTVRAVLFTHLHVDHSVDFAGYIKSAFFSDRNQDLYVYGPEGNRFLPSMDKFVQSVIGASNSSYPYLSSYLDGSDDYRIHVKNLPVGKRDIINVSRTGDLQLSAVPVHHGPLPAVAWRVDIAGKTLVFSGDMNGDYETLPALAMNADILVAHHAVPDGASGVARNLHMTPSVIGKIAKQAGVKKLVLSHRMHRTLGREKNALSSINQHYSGPVVFANDLDCFLM